MPIRSYRRTDVPMDNSPDDAPRQDASFLPGATCSIGRAKYHDIVLNSPHISEDHAVVHNHAQHGLLVIDLYTEAGTFVSSERLPPLRPLPLRALSDLAIPIYGISTGATEVADLVARIAEVLRTETNFPNELGRLFVPPHPFAYDPSSPQPPTISAPRWTPTPAVTKTPQARTPFEPCAQPAPAPPSPSTPPRSTRQFSPLPTRTQRTTRVSGASPMAPRVSPSRIFQHASPGRIFNHPSPARSPSLASVRVPSPLGAPRGSPAPRASPLGPRVDTRRTPDVNVRAGGAYPNLAPEMSAMREAQPQAPTSRTSRTSTTPHPQDADTMPNTGPFPRPILRTKAKRDVADDESSRPRKRMRMDDADMLVRGMPGAWPYESTGVRAESLKERVERERGGRRRVRFGEPSVWVRAEA